jgi:hypothetical protein
MRSAFASDPYRHLSDEWLQGDHLKERLRQVAGELCGDGWFEEPNARLDWQSPDEAVDAGHVDEVKHVLRTIATGGGG